MALSNRDKVGKALDLVADGLGPFVNRAMPVVRGRDWFEQHAERERQSGRPVTLSRKDPRLLLRVISENSRAFRETLSRTEIAFAQEAREHGHRWAHNTPFSDPDTLRALDTMARLLYAAGATAQAEQVEKLHADHQRATFEKATRKAARESAALPGLEGMGLKPWRDVLRPHADVATGRFTASQFAANLYTVAEREAEAEYGDPVEFFRRTYLTEGLRDLLTRAVRRISGDATAAPVINLQTNFGGGKTHSMLALYHLFSGRPLEDYPQEVQELLEGSDLAKLGGEVRRVTLVGTHLPPDLGMRKLDGTHVHTLWGELAWQLGGKAAYDSIAGADQTGTNPGAALTDLIAAYSPCVILIDEWVAYARQLVGAKLPAGSFETQFTFAQTLTEAVASLPGALLVVSIPASDRGDRDASTIEVGGPNGQEALRLLQNVVRRVADQWRPASAQESFEIVRRRLFEEPSGDARADIAAVARRFTQFYASGREHFPSGCAEPAYERRIRDAYPIHPELFARLYEDWSTLERFQRTRGVLRLMSTVIYALWKDNDTYPLIMPATVPIADDRVYTDLTQYLEDSWKTIVDTDVDGADSTPARIDRERPTFGQRALTRRIARTIFFGSAATLKSANKGIDARNIWLGTATPGDTLGHFDSAAHALVDQATYLYTEASRYWYDTQASVGRAAKDYAERLRDRHEEVWNEIVKRLEPYKRRDRGDFAAVHVAPEETGDIEDSDLARLVIMHPRFVYQRNGDDSAAMSFVRHALETRGSAQRRHRNALVFLAPDARRYEELAEAVREYLAWEYICKHHKEMDLPPTQLDQAESRRRRADGVVDQRIGTSYIWVITPRQPDPARPMNLEADKAESQAAELPERVSEKLRRYGDLAAVQAPSVIHQHLDTELKRLWDRGHISVGELWQTYTDYPYMPRLRDRSVLEQGLRDVLDLITWELEGFALATGYDEATGRYQGLAIPHADITFGAITDHVLLVRPDRALRQRQEDLTAATTSGTVTGGSSTTPVQPGTPGVISPTGGNAVPGPPQPTGIKPKGRFFGVYRIDSERYARDLTRLQQEILPHLADPDVGELRITVEIEATHPGGFPEDKIRTVTENARVLKFERAEFDEGS